MKHSLTIACLLGAGLFAAQAALAADIYRWTDAQGKVHLTDRKPPPDAKDVTRVDSSQHKAVAADAEVARRQAASDRARLARIEAEKADAARIKAAASAAAGTGAGQAVAGAAGGAGGGSECDQKKRAYQASANCWGGFNLAKGGTREGALAKCGPPMDQPVCN